MHNASGPFILTYLRPLIQSEHLEMSVVLKQKGICIENIALLSPVDCLGVDRRLKMDWS